MTIGAASGWLASALSWVLGLLATPAFWIGVGLPVVAVLAFRRRGHSVTASVGLPFSLGSMTYDTSPADQIAAWQLYVQLITRKAALPFDPDADLVVDVFDSLFELFPISRRLLSDLPPRHFSRDAGVASLIVRVLNLGLRPKLTRWQSEFRAWWAVASKEPANLARRPQDVQRDFPSYKRLFADLSEMNTELAKFADELFEIASAGKVPWYQRFRRPTKVQALAPADVPADTELQAREEGPTLPSSRADDAVL